MSTLDQFTTRHDGVRLEAKAAAKPGCLGCHFDTHKDGCWRNPCTRGDFVAGQGKLPVNIIWIRA